MSALLITYDLNRESKRPPITQKIKDISGSWARLSESSYAIGTTLSPQQVYNLLQPLLDADDQLFVITLVNPWWGQGPQDVRDWLRNNL